MSEQAKGVYAIRNTKTGCVYIGATTVSFAVRWRQHAQALKKGVHVNAKLQGDWSDLGSAAFCFSILEEVGDDALILLAERGHIAAATAPLYNIIRFGRPHIRALYAPTDGGLSALMARLLEAEEVYESVTREAGSQGGPLVRQARRDLAMTQRALAHALGVSHTYISKIEHGHAPVSRLLLGRLARLLAGLPVDDKGGRALASG